MINWETEGQLVNGYVDGQLVFTIQHSNKRYTLTITEPFRQIQFNGCTCAGTKKQIYNLKQIAEKIFIDQQQEVAFSEELSQMLASLDLAVVKWN